MQNITNFIKTHRLKAKFTAFCCSPIGFTKTKINDLIYFVRCFFKPFNVVTLHNLPRSWTDRDSLMFHAMFQILVDFVELEQPFRSWSDERKFKEKRHTDREEMRAWIEKHYNTEEGRADNRNEWMTPEENARMDAQTEHRYQRHLEILYLYEWYKDEKYEFDFSYYYNATGEKLKMSVDGMKTVKTGKPSLITWDEFHEIETEHKIVCDVMLKRILGVRDYLWT